MGDVEIPDELIDQLLGEDEGAGPEQLTGPDGLIDQLRKRPIERAAGAGLGQHRLAAGGSRRRGSRTRATASRRRRYGRATGRSRSSRPGIATRASSRGSCPSTPVLSPVRRRSQDDVGAWQSRPLEELSVVVYLDALQVAIRDPQVVRKRAGGAMSR